MRTIFAGSLALVFCMFISHCGVSEGSLPSFAFAVQKSGSLQSPKSSKQTNNRHIVGRAGDSGKCAVATDVPAYPKPRFTLVGLWGVLGVVSIIGNAVKRLLPVALEPFSKNHAPLSPPMWAAYGIFTAYMAYTEGYKAFQQKFAPLVVQRSLTLETNPSFVNYLFAAPYTMGLFHASRKRTIVSWSISLAVVALVQIVKRLPYPYRSIVDAGVVSGLTWGSISILTHYLRAVIFKVGPEVDPCLP